MDTRLQVYYDGQCEICQASVTWLRLLDRRRRAEPIPIDSEALHQARTPLDLEACLRELHVVDQTGRVLVGWDAVARLARLSPATWIIGALGSAPPLHWLGRAAYGFVARNRYTLSKCRGGVCGVADPGEVRRRSPLAPFWTCYTLGMLLRLPLSLLACLKDVALRPVTHLRTFRRRLDLLDGKLTICFLGGARPDLVPVLFGERFTMVLYKGIAVDPGSPLMRRSLVRHLRRLPPGRVAAVLATHHHEEHVGNLNWLARREGVPLFVAQETARILLSPRRLPRVRGWIIGEPPRLQEPYRVLGDTLEVSGSRFQILPAPGHCDDHVVLYDPQEKALIAGDAFMGSYFSTPNPDVDSLLWIETLQRLLDLDVEILVEGHGHIHTLRADVPDVPGVVVRRDPRAALREKLRFLRWVRDQIESGRSEGLPTRAIEATCFPWRATWGWERFLNDEMTRLLSLGHFSRSELVRSFVRPPQGRGPFPTVYEARLYETSQPPQATAERPAGRLGGSQTMRSPGP